MSSDAFYNDMAAVMTELLTEFGSTVSVTRTSGATNDPITGVSGGSASTLSPVGLLTDYKDSMIDGTLIHRGDRMLVLDNSITPLSTDKPNIGGEKWRIMNIKTIKPAAVVVGYFIQVRK